MADARLSLPLPLPLPPCSAAVQNPKKESRALLVSAMFRPQIWISGTLDHVLSAVVVAQHVRNLAPGCAFLKDIGLWGFFFPRGTVVPEGTETVTEILPVPTCTKSLPCLSTGSLYLCRVTQVQAETVNRSDCDNYLCTLDKVLKRNPLALRLSPAVKHVDKPSSDVSATDRLRAPTATSINEAAAVRVVAAAYCGKALCAKSPCGGAYSRCFDL